jgi:LysM repeat protein
VVAVTADQMTGWIGAVVAAAVLAAGVVSLGRPVVVADAAPPAQEEPPGAAAVEEALPEPTAPPEAAGEGGAPAPPATGTYTVGPGDTLSTIAAAFGISVEELLALNALTDPDRLMLGQELVVPQPTDG